MKNFIDNEKEIIEKCEELTEEICRICLSYVISLKELSGKDIPHVMLISLVQSLTRVSYAYAQFFGIDFYEVKDHVLEMIDTSFDSHYKSIHEKMNEE